MRQEYILTPPRLLSAYDLLTSGYVPAGTYNEGHVNALLSQAKTLGDKLKVQFDSPSGLPMAFINFTTNTPINGQFTNPLNNVTYNATNTAVAGTSILEFYRLSDLTGDESFRALVGRSLQVGKRLSNLLTKNCQVDRAEGNLVFPNPNPVYPGLVGSELDVDSGNYLTFDFGWHGGIDSFYEVFFFSTD